MTAWLSGVAAAIIVILVGVVLIARRKMGARPLPHLLKPGRQLPAFSAVGEDGRELSSRDLTGKPAVILFVRGNWCPFCSRQVTNLTPHYQRINELGARLILVTPKPLETTKRVAEFFNVDFEFWLDENLEIGKQLGLLLEEGVPAGYLSEYGKDTLWPASLVTDAEGVIRYASISRVIADRPDPRKFVTTLESMRENAT